MRFYPYLVLAVTGVLSAFSLILPVFSYVALFLLVPLLFFLRRETGLGKIFWLVNAFSLFYTATVYAFSIVEIIHYFLSVLVFSIFAVLIWTGKKLLPKGLFVVYAPLFFVMSEYARSVVSYLPAYSSVIGNSLASTYFLGLSKIFGFWGLSFFVVLVNSALAFGLILNGKRKIYYYFGAGLIMAGCLAASFWLIGLNRRSDAEIDIAVASSRREYKNTDEQYELWDRLEADDEFLDGYWQKVNQLIEDKLESEREFIFFPSNIFDTDRLDERDEDAYAIYGVYNNGRVISFFRNLAINRSAGVVFGLFTSVADRDYVSILYIDREGKIRGKYDKSELLIGSDYWPFGNWVPFYWRWFEDFPEDGNVIIDPGLSKSLTPFSLINLGELKIAPLICSETSKPLNFYRAKKNGADAVYAAVNNNWYYGFNFDYFLRLHTNIMRISAVAYDLPIIVGGKDNYAGIIYPDGRMDVEEIPNQGNEYHGFFLWQGSMKY